MEANYEKLTSPDSSAQEQWDNITKACIDAATTTIPKEKQKKSDNSEIAELSIKQKKIRLDINANKDKDKRVALRKERNQILKKIHITLAEEELAHINDLVSEVENSRNDSNQMYKAIRALKSIKPKKSLVVQGENGLATDEKQQTEIITGHFSKVFVEEDEEDIEIIQLKEMTTPFTMKEVQDAVISLSNNKSAGCDNLKAELIKHSPETIFQGIAILLNHIAATGEYPKEMKT